jgi:hypothetical protein
MPSRKTTTLLLIIFLLLVKTQQSFALPQQQDFPALLQQLAALSPDPCITVDGKIEPATTSKTMALLFDRAADAVIERLNETGSAQPRDRATAALKKLEQLSAETNAAWPEESRFHFQILDLSASALAVKMAFRFGAKFYVFGVSQQDDFGKPNWLWHKVGEEPPLESFGNHSISLYPLHHGPSGNARFLASVQSLGCAGSTGISYDVREWSPSGMGSLEQIIKQDGAFGLDDNVQGFPRSAN